MSQEGQQQQGGQQQQMNNNTATTIDRTNPAYLNNLAVIQIRQGEYQNAITTLSLSLPALRDQATIVSAAAAAAAATNTPPPPPTHASLNDVVYRAYKRFEKANTTTSSNTITTTSSICNQPLKLPDQPTTLDGYYYEFMSATILFNLGLAYHLIALSIMDTIKTTTDHTQETMQQQQQQQQHYLIRQERSKTFFIKASRIYEYAYTLVCNSSNATIRNSLLFTTIMHNNMGLLYCHLGDYTRQRQCFEHLLIMLMSNAHEVVTTNTMSINSSTNHHNHHLNTNATIIPPQYLLDIFFQNVYTYTQYHDGKLLLNRHFIAASAA